MHSHLSVTSPNTMYCRGEPEQLHEHIDFGTILHEILSHSLLLYKSKGPKDHIKQILECIQLTLQNLH